MRGVSLALLLVALAAFAGALDDSAQDSTFVEALVDNPVEDMEKSSASAEDEDELKINMKASVSKAMADKKKDLLAIAADTAAKMTKDAAAKQAAHDEEMRKKKAKAELEMANAEARSARSQLVNTDGNQQLAHETTQAEEKAKIATANRIAAEETAKQSTALRLAAEEDAKKAAAIKLTSREQEQATAKSPEQLQAMSAQAFKQAADLKIREAEALAKVASDKEGTELQRTEEKDEAQTGVERTTLKDAKRRLEHAVSNAKDALVAAKAKPFDKALLKDVVDWKHKVEKMKRQVERLSKEVEGDEENVEREKAEERPAMQTRHPEEASEDVHHNEGSGEDGHGQKHETEEEMENDNMKRDPSTRKWTEDEIKYWANKEVKWTYDDPLNKNAVMGKIFQIKDMEAQTLMKMNELKVRNMLDPDGPNAKALADGQNVIMGGEILRANPTFHINHVFQGQKGKNPMADMKSRDPARDELNMQTYDQVMNHVGRIKAEGAEELARAVHARKPVPDFDDVVNGFVPVNEPSAPNPTLAELKKSVKDNKKIVGVDPEEEAKEVAEKEAKGPGEEPDAEAKAADAKAGDTTLGETADDDTMEHIAEQEDEDAMADDNDVSMLMDENSLEDGIDSN